MFFGRVGDDPNAIRFLQRMDNLEENTKEPSIGKNVETKSDN